MKFLQIFSLKCLIFSHFQLDLNVQSNFVEVALKFCIFSWDVTKNLTLSEEKIRWIGSEIPGENGEFHIQFNEIWLKIQIEVKIGEIKRKRHLKQKIGKIFTKFQNFQAQNSLSEIVQRSRKFRIWERIKRNLIEYSNRSQNGRKKTPFERENLRNFHENSLNWN